MIGKFRFYKTSANRWYIDLPEWTGSIDELEMVQGADTMLDVVSDNTSKCHLTISDEPFEEADEIRLVTDLRDSVGGGDYLMEKYKGEQLNQEMWICGVVEHVFGLIPPVIYVGYPI
jgi:hypothetical protein